MIPTLPLERYEPVTEGGYPWAAGSQRTRRLFIARVVWLLKEAGGEIRSASVSLSLREALAARGVEAPTPGALNATLREMEGLGLIERDVGTKRTYALRVRPDAHLPPNPRDIDRAAAQPAAPEPAEPQPAREAEPAPVPALARDQAVLLIMRLAGALLVDEVRATPEPETEPAVAERLAAALDRCRTLEEKLARAEGRRREAEDLATAHGRALRGERLARQQVEANLRAVMDALRKVQPGPSEREQLDRLMRQVPA